MVKYGQPVQDVSCGTPVVVPSSLLMVYLGCMLNQVEENLMAFATQWKVLDLLDKSMAHTTPNYKGVNNSSFSVERSASKIVAFSVMRNLLNLLSKQRKKTDFSKIL